jgi:hypothetical protein
MLNVGKADPPKGFSKVGTLFRNDPMRFYGGLNTVATDDNGPDEVFDGTFK